MLAVPAESPADALARVADQQCAAQVKFDGERVQVHKLGSTVRVWSRTLRSVPASKLGAPLLNALASLPVHSCVLDGELVLAEHGTDRILPFGSLGVKRREEHANARPVLLLFDALLLDADDGSVTSSPPAKSFIDLPWRERQARLWATLTTEPPRDGLVRNATELMQRSAVRGDTSASVQVVPAMVSDVQVVILVRFVFDPESALCAVCPLTHPFVTALLASSFRRAPRLRHSSTKWLCAADTKA